jgi:Bacterial Ig domain
LPTVSLASNGLSFTSPAKISLTATASDADGTVTRVEFFNGTTRLGEDTTAPYTNQWNTGAAGNYRVTARATDNAGGTGTSNELLITVNKKR